MRTGCFLAFFLLADLRFVQADDKPTAPPPPGSLHLVEGRFGKALDARATPVVIDGSDRFRTPPLTVECWAKLFSKKEHNILVGCDHKSSGRHWEIHSHGGTGGFSASLPGMQPADITSTADICDGKWHFLAMTFDGKTVMLFVDGKMVREQAVKPRTGARPEAGPLTIGLAIHDKQRRVGCDGLIDEVRLSSIVRKIEGVPEKPLPLDIPTVGLWRFDLADAADVDPAWTPRPTEGGDGEPWEKESDKDWVDPRFQQMDTGPFLNATFSYPGVGAKPFAFKGTAIRLGEKGEAGVIYDRCQLRLVVGWTGGFLTHSSRRFGLLNTPAFAGKPTFIAQPGPGWLAAKDSWETSQPATAPRAEWGQFLGTYLHGQRVIQSWQFRGVSILESPWVESRDGVSILTRSLEIGPSKEELHLLVGTMPPGEKTYGPLGEDGSFHVVRGADSSSAFVLGTERETVKVRLRADGRIIAVIPTRTEALRLKFLYWSGRPGDYLAYRREVEKFTRPSDLRAWIKGGPPRWKPLVTKGERGKDDGPFAIDTLTIPYDNPYKALFFGGGVDALPNGDLAMCTAHGDVWIVSGVDDKLEKLTWRRFATGLYQPLGLKVVEGKIVVLERGQLTRLHDLNNDGEADFYECVNNDWHVAGGEHAFDTCLETDPRGNFYFFKTGDTQTPTGGCLLRVSKDGKKSEVFATGFRHPIGLGMSPMGIVTGADQEGNWMPATRVDQYKQGGFYGDMRAHHRETPPKTYDPPLCWLPRQMDNSAGGQVWVPEGKWGPLSGQMLHLSYGRCRMMLMLRQEVGDLVQGGAVDLGLQFLAGVARGRFHPDGHLYLTGLRGWQTAAKRDGCLQRVRYTGKKILIPVGLSVHDRGVKLTFAQKLDAQQAEDAKRYTVEQWNYRWSGDYGSQRWSVAHPDRVGQDRVIVKSARLQPDGKRVFLELAEVKPVMQMQIRYGLSSAEGEPLVGVISNTIHRTPARE